MITTTLTTAAKKLFLESVAHDRCKIALYTSQAELGADTNKYTPENEVTARGYKAGGLPLSGAKVTVDSSGSVSLTWDDVEWPVATMTAAGYIIYDTLHGNAALFVGGWGGEFTSTNGPFRVPISENQIVLL